MAVVASPAVVTVAGIGLAVWLRNTALDWLKRAPVGAQSVEVQRRVLESLYGAPEPPQEPLEAPYVTQAQERESVLDWELQGINAQRIALGLAPLSAEDYLADAERQYAA